MLHKQHSSCDSYRLLWHPLQLTLLSILSFVNGHLESYDSRCATTKGRLDQGTGERSEE
jgi:hypothetical protein